MGVDSILTGVPQFDNLEVVKAATTSVAFAADGTTETTTVAHGLDFVPIVMAFLDNGTYKVPLPSIGVESSGAEEGLVYQVISFYADETNIYFFNQSNLQGTAGGTISYYILRLRASTS